MVVDIYLLLLIYDFLLLLCALCPPPVDVLFFGLLYSVYDASVLLLMAFHSMTNPKDKGAISGAIRRSCVTLWEVG